MLLFRVLFYIKIMRVEVKEENTILLFPCLMIGDEDIIVLFTKPKCGILIKTNWSNSGDYHEDWDMKRFKSFKGEIILSNK